MNQSKIYHGGSMGGSKGFSGGVASPTKYLYEKIWIPSTELRSHTSFPPNGPTTKALPNTVQTHVWVFTASEQDMAFAWIPKVSRYWNHNLTVPTSCNLRLYWYGETTQAKQVCWGVELCFVRNGETLNFVPPAWTQMYLTGITAYQQNITLRSDFPIFNPSGSAAINEGTFFLKVIRDGSNAEDTYDFEALLLGVSIEFPLVYP
jgi:hypothetical protein